MNPKMDMIKVLEKIFNGCHCIPSHHCEDCVRARKLLELLSDPRVIIAYRGDNQ